MCEKKTTIRIVYENRKKKKKMKQYFLHLFFNIRSVKSISDFSFPLLLKTKTDARKRQKETVYLFVQTMLKIHDYFCWESRKTTKSIIRATYFLSSFFFFLKNSRPRAIAYIHFSFLLAGKTYFNQ